MAKLDLNVLAVESSSKYQVIQFKGEMDKSNNAQVREALTRFIESFQLDYLFFDLTYFDFINSEGVGMLVSMYYKMKQSNKNLFILNPQPRVNDVFNIIGLSKIVPIYPNLETAIQNVN